MYYPRLHLPGVEQSGSWVAAIVGWDNDLHRHSDQAFSICQGLHRVN